MIQNLIFGVLFLKNLFRAYNVFICLSRGSSGHRQSFFYFRFSSRKFQIQQKLVLWTSTHLALKLICFCNTVKRLSDFINFPATMFLVSEKIFAFSISRHPRTALSKHSVRKWLYISIYLLNKIFVPET